MDSQILVGHAPRLFDPCKVPEVMWTTFEPIKHEYSYDEDGKIENRRQIPITATGIVKKVFEFDADANAGRIAEDFLKYGKSPYDKKLAEIFANSSYHIHQGYGQQHNFLTSLVLKKWAEAERFGTFVHDKLEKYISGKHVPDRRIGIEEMVSINAGIKFLTEDRAQGYVPMDTPEIRIAAPTLRTKFHTKGMPNGIAGSIDFLLYHEKSGNCVIGDFKTSKKSSDKYLKETLEKWKLQLGVYHLLLSNAKIPGYKPVAMVIYQIHPEYHKKHIFTVEQCEKAVNAALGMNMF